MNFYEIKSKIIKWFGNITIYPYPMFIMFGSYGYKIKGPDVRKLIEILRPGDIVLRRYNHYISGLLIPGFWTHSSLYVGNDNIIHILGEGIIKEDILTFTRCDAICVLRKKDNAVGTTPIEAIQCAENLFENKIQYDFEFSENPDKLYCSEFTHVCYGKPALSKKLKKKGFILPDDQLNYINFDIMWSKST